MNYIALSIPAFFFLIAVELVYSFWKGRKLYRFNDTITNISLGIGQQVTGLLMKVVLAYGYVKLYGSFALLEIESSVLNWVLLFIGVDFFYYWFHRLSHEINALWAAHIVHHQSEEYNLSVALRQSWLQSWFSWVFYLPLAVIGFKPEMFFLMSAVNTLYQFWIHTRALGKLGPLEWIINTPSHHRVHHGSDPEYLDKNHAGTLIIWDRMFGTFQEEKEEPVYGITTPLKSWNPVWANFHYWQEMWDLAVRSEGILDKIRAFIKPPGWKPAYLGGREIPKSIDKSTYKKYDADGSRIVQIYVAVVFIQSMALSVAMLFGFPDFGNLELAHLTISTILGLLVCGGLLEGHKMVRNAEFARILVLIFGFGLLYQNLNFSWISGTLMVSCVINLIVFRYLSGVIAIAPNKTQ